MVYWLVLDVADLMWGILMALKDVRFGLLGVRGLHRNILEEFFSLSKNALVPKPSE